MAQRRAGGGRFDLCGDLNTDDSYAYLVPAYLIFAIWIGLSVDLALAALARRRRAQLAATLALATLLAWRAASIAPQVDASQDRRAIDYATAVLADAPRGAIVVSEADRDTFPLWYYHYALGQRPDLAVLVDPLLDFERKRACWNARSLLDRPRAAGDHGWDAPRAPTPICIATNDPRVGAQGGRPQGTPTMMLQNLLDGNLDVMHKYAGTHCVPAYL